MLSLTAAAPPEPCCHSQQIADGICAAAGETHDTVIHTAFFFFYQPNKSNTGKIYLQVGY